MGGGKKTPAVRIVIPLQRGPRRDYPFPPLSRKRSRAFFPIPFVFVISLKAVPHAERPENRPNSRKIVATMKPEVPQTASAFKEAARPDRLCACSQTTRSTHMAGGRAEYISNSFTQAKMIALLPPARRVIAGRRGNRGKGQWKSSFPASKCRCDSIAINILAHLSSPLSPHVLPSNFYQSSVDVSHGMASLPLRVSQSRANGLS
jgi:hypothetical protein